ncbi:cupredoxin domain-containing protein [Winogradskyella echinorum]|uniref:Cupredoxin domain-containing protein n=1 Tax=Winogradskyella echinorum TaxID=538189 RepID=A0ABR6XYU8_9FLAO|nr:cupredoxin domain-containing protein [Winogradskyella echinorum]MBC3845579.1 cupredoxin domain-containing protein [Winogradskyella echinorum]MBC5749927.1 cupredoxin domain-containing protein [Winogradskyella echinorum]
MKKIISILVIALTFTLIGNAQDKMKAKATVVTLEQTKGEFTQKEITLKEGNYIFEISNNNVGHKVGFVLVPKGKDASKPENHISTAYVTKAVENNTKETSKVTTLAKGEYVYFCPLNPTPQYTLIVE